MIAWLDKKVHLKALLYQKKKNPSNFGCLWVGELGEEDRDRKETFYCKSFNTFWFLKNALPIKNLLSFLIKVLKLSKVQNFFTII